MKKILMVLVFAIIVILSMMFLVSGNDTETVEYTATTKTVHHADGTSTLTIYSTTMFAQNSSGDWVNSSDVFSMTKYHDDITFHYDGIDGYYNITFEAGVIYNGNYFSFSEIKQIKPGLEYDFPKERFDTHIKYAVNISNITANINATLIENITLTYKNHYGFNLSELVQGDRLFNIKNTMALYFNDLFELYDVTLNKTEKRIYIGNITDNVIDDCLYLDPTITLQTADTENLGDVSIHSATPDSNSGYTSTFDATSGDVAYIMFDMTSIPSGASIDKAVLSLYVYVHENAGESRIYELHDWDWNETVPTWNSPVSGAWGNVLDNIPWFDSAVDAWDNFDTLSSGHAGHNITTWTKYCYENNNSCSFVISCDDCPTNKGWRTKEWTTASERPKLVVDYTLVGVSFENNMSSPKLPRAYDNVTFSIDVVENYNNNVYVSNFTLWHPNGTIIFRENGTQVGETWNSQSGHRILTNGTYTIDLNVTEESGVNTTFSWKFNVTFGTLSVLSPNGSREHEFSVSAGNFKLFNLSASHTGNSNNTLFMNFSSNITSVAGINTSIVSGARFETVSRNVTNGTAITDIEINVSVNSSTSSGNYIGYITWQRTDDDGVDMNGSVEINITVSSLSADINIIEPSSFYIAKTPTESNHVSMEVNNTGNYNGTSCNGQVSSSLGVTASFNRTNFVIENQTSISLGVDISGGSAGIDSSASIIVSCVATPTGSVDSDNIYGSIAIVGGVTETPPEGGGATRVICGDGLCQYPENNETCPQDCAGVRFLLSSTEYAYPAVAGSSIVCPLLFGNPCLGNYTEGCPITIINPTDKELIIDVNIKKISDNSNTWAMLYDMDGSLKESIKIIVQPKSERDVIIKVDVPEETLDGVYAFRIQFTEISGDVFFDYNINVNTAYGTFYGLLSKYVLGHVCIGEFPFPLWAGWMFGFIGIVIVVAGFTRKR